MSSLPTQLKHRLHGCLLENELLSKHTTFRIGGPARYFYVAHTPEMVIEAVRVCRELKISYYLLGGGSNVLASDEGFDGFVIKLQAEPLALRSGTLIETSEFGDSVEFRASAVIPTGFLVSYALSQKYSGLEFLAGVPGTLGGAVAANAHAYFLGSYYKQSQVIRDRIKWIEIFTLENEEKQVYPEYYHWSSTGVDIIVRGDIVLRVGLMLKKMDEEEYQNAEQYLAQYREFRSQKPYQKYPTAGSVFRNHLITPKTPLQNIDESFIQKGIIPAGWLIEKMGLKGERMGDAQISQEHANFIINLGNAKSADVANLMKICKDRVMEMFEIVLEEEIRRLE